MHHRILLPRRQLALILPIVFALLALLPAAPLRAAGVIYVVSGGAGAQTGADWINAKDLQAALQSATSGDQIWVKAGIYKPTTGADRSATFQLKSGVAVYGGFAGTEDALDQRDPAAHVSTLSGDLLGNDSGAVASNNPTRSDNSYHVVTSNGTNATAALDGFTITAGNANGNSLPNYNGGGLSNLFGNSTIRNTLFIGNSAANAGGGVDNDNSLSIFDHVLFSENTAYSGGAMFNFYSNVTISFAIFSQNTSLSDGGGIYNYASDASISHSLFVGNSGTRGGGMLNIVGLPTISQTTFANNSATSGGAIANVGGAANPIIQNAILWGNTGGQIFNGSNDQPIVRFALVQGGYSSGTHIIDADPLFADADGVDNIAGTADDNLRLQVGSPAINTGNNAFIPLDLTDENNNNDFSEPAPFDLDRNQRLINTTVDMGAYERQPLAITSASPAATATYGTPYSHTFTTNEGSGPTFAIGSGTLPPGLMLDPNGILSGIPTLAGTYSGITATATSAYGSASQTFTIIVDRAQLTITADDKTRLFGAPNPLLTASYSGFVNGDTPASLDVPVSLATTATITSPPGTYPITASDAADTNYNITFTPATLTITGRHTYMALISR